MTPPGVIAGFLGDAVLGLDMEFLPFGERAEFWPFAVGRRSVFSRGKGAFAGLSRASGGERDGKLMTCSLNGTE